MSDKSSYIGLAGEFRVMSELLLRKHNPAKSYLDDGCDLLLENGLKLQVKSRHLKHDGQKNKRYAFCFRGQGYYKKLPKNRNNIDFIICWGILESTLTGVVKFVRD